MHYVIGNFAAIGLSLLLPSYLYARELPRHPSADESRPPAMWSERGGSRNTGASGIETQRGATIERANAAAADSDTARGSKSEQGSPEKLYGIWFADDVDVKIGEVRIELTFFDEGPVKIVAWSELPFIGKVKHAKWPYEVQGDTIRSKAIRGGTKAKYWFEGERLVLQFEDGKTVRFHRE